MWPRYYHWILQKEEGGKEDKSEAGKDEASSKDKKKLKEEKKKKEKEEKERKKKEEKEKKEKEAKKKEPKKPKVETTKEELTFTQERYNKQRVGPELFDGSMECLFKLHLEILCVQLNKHGIFLTITYALSLRFSLKRHLYLEV